MENRDEKLVLLEHLRQLNDTLTRLSARRRRLRAERRVRISQLKSQLTFGLSFALTALAAVLAMFGLPIFAVDQVLFYLIITVVLFFVVLYTLIYFSLQNSSKFAQQRWVKRRIAGVDNKIVRIDAEIRSLLSVEFLEEVPFDGKFIDKKLLAEAQEMVEEEPDITWVEVTRRLDTQLMLKRTRRQSLFASEWFRLFGANFPNKKTV